MSSLYNRFVTQGTLSDPDEVPDPRFALPSAVNWMRALSILVQDRSLDFGSASSFYSGVQKRVATVREENTTFEQLLFAAHQLSALEALGLRHRRPMWRGWALWPGITAFTQLQVP